jgi:hypothetical protein
VEVRLTKTAGGREGGRDWIRRETGEGGEELGEQQEDAVREDKTPVRASATRIHAERIVNTHRSDMQMSSSSHCSLYGSSCPAPSRGPRRRRHGTRAARGPCPRQRIGAPIARPDTGQRPRIEWRLTTPDTSAAHARASCSRPSTTRAGCARPTQGTRTRMSTLMPMRRTRGAIHRVDMTDMLRPRRGRVLGDGGVAMY